MRRYFWWALLMSSLAGGSGCATLLVTGAAEPERSSTGAAEAALADRVARALRDRAALAADAVRVDVNGQTVTLTGQVATRATKERATTVAQRVDGVTHVINRLSVLSGT